MDKEDIKVGNVWIEESNEIKKKIFGFYSFSIISLMFISSLLITYCNLLLVFLLILDIFTVIYLARNLSFPPVLSNELFAIHYTTNVDFTKDIADYHEMFDRMKEYYENETYFEKYEKYKIKRTIFLYNKYGKNKINWVKEQNEKTKLLEYNA